MIMYNNVVVGINGVKLLASNAQISESYPHEGVRGYGDHSISPTGVYESGRKEQTLSMTYFLNSEESMLPFSLTGVQFATVQVKDRMFSGLVTSAQVSADPLNPVSANVSFLCYAEQAGEELSDMETGRLYHGGGSSLSSVPPLINSNLYGFSVSMTQSFTPYYMLGSHDLSCVEAIGGTFSVNMQGTGVAAPPEFPCQEPTGLTITLADICGASSDTIVLDSMRQTSFEESISAEDQLVWAADFVRFF